MQNAANSFFERKADGVDKALKLPPIANAEEVFYKYSEMVYRLALNRCRCKSDAEDVMQDVFVRYVRRKPTFDSAEHQRAWLIRATINCTNSMLSSAWYKNTTSLIEDIPFNMQNEWDVYSAVLRLNRNQRTAVHLYYYEGYTVKEIARLVDTKPNTVKSWLKRARERLEQELKGDYFDV